MKITKAILSAYILSALSLASCATTSNTLTIDEEPHDDINSGEIVFQQPLPSIEEDDFLNAMLALEHVRGEPLVEREIHYVEAPTVNYDKNLKIATSSEVEPSKLTGEKAIQAGYKDMLTPAEYSEGHLKAWVYQKQRIYEVHTQTLHTTVIQLEPGEELLEIPYLSEPEVWKLSRGTGLVDGLPTTYLMLKPDYSKLESTMVVITNKRVYQLLITSHTNHYMPFVQWVYNDAAPIKLDSTAKSPAMSALKNPKFQNSLDTITAAMSFNYTIKSSKPKPYWHPVMVFDDGQMTYIVLDKTCVNMQVPGVFGNSKDIINFSTNENIITIPHLITKVTLRLGKETVTITKDKN